MPHTADRHGRTVTIQQIRRGLAVTVNGCVRGTLLQRGIRDGRSVWQPVTYDHVWLDEMVGDYVDAERALLDATTELD